MPKECSDSNGPSIIKASVPEENEVHYPVSQMMHLLLNNEHLSSFQKTENIIPVDALEKQSP